MITKEILAITILENTPPDSIQEAVAKLTHGDYTVTLTKAQDDEIQGNLTYRDGTEHGRIHFTGAETEKEKTYTLMCPNCAQVWSGNFCWHSAAVALSVMDSPAVTLAALIASQGKQRQRRKKGDERRSAKPEVIHIGTCLPQLMDPARWAAVQEKLAA